MLCHRARLLYVSCGVTLKKKEFERDGHSYDRRSIKKWLNTSNLSPMTNKKLSHKNLVPNHNLRKAIEEEVQKKLKARENTKAVSEKAEMTKGEGIESEEKQA